MKLFLPCCGLTNIATPLWEFVFCLFCRLVCAVSEGVWEGGLWGSCFCIAVVRAVCWKRVGISFPLSGVEGFYVITRVSRNGSALTSHLLRRARSITDESVRRRVLSDVSLRERHNVAVGTRTIALCCGTSSNRGCRLGLVSAPNRISFGCRISHSLTTYRNTILVISTDRNVRTRALTGACLTISRKLRVLPIVGGVSLPSTRPREIGTRVRSVVNVPTSGTPLVSTGANVGVRRILRGVIARVPTPGNSENTPLSTLVFSSCCSSCGNIVMCFEIINNGVGANSAVHVVTANTRFGVIRLNHGNTATLRPYSVLRTNRINCLTTSVGAIDRTHINSAVALTSRPIGSTLPNCHGMGPIIFYNVCPTSNTGCPSLHSTLSGLRLGSTSLVFRTRSSGTLNFNFHYNFLKLLRVRVVRRHLRHRCGLSLMAATPDIRCGFALADNRAVAISGPAGCPSPTVVISTLRPITSIRVCSPDDFINAVVRLYRRHHNICASVGCVNSHISVRCVVPVNRVICSFFSTLGSHAGNCTDCSCRVGKCRGSGLMGLSILLTNSVMSTLSFVIRDSGTCTHTHGVTRGLGRFVPHRLFRIPIRITMSNGIVTHRAMGTVHGSILTGYCNNSVAHGGGLLRGRGRNGGHVHQLNGMRIPRRTFVTILGLSR